MNTDLEIFVACLPGLEPYVALECAELGVPLDPGGGRRSEGGVRCRGDMSAVLRANLGLGCASHVLVRVACFRALHFHELRRRADDVRWESWLRPGAPFVVRASSRHSKLWHTDAIAERVTASIADALGAPPGEDDAVPVHVRLVDDLCTVSIDTSGRPLHERGWRLESAKAPLREDLAHALVMAAGWNPGTPLCDPFCGSGTIPIVAAQRARRLAPGLARGFAFDRLGCVDPELARAVRDELAGRALARAPAPIRGSDRDAGAVAIAGRNAARAGVDADVELAVAPMSAAPGLAESVPPGAVVTNPPFGRRVGDADRLAPLYQALGARLRALGPGWHVAVLAADRRLALRTGMPLRTAFLASHGGLRVRALVV